MTGTDGKEKYVMFSEVDGQIYEYIFRVYPMPHTNIHALHAYHKINNFCACALAFLKNASSSLSMS